MNATNTKKTVIIGASDNPSRYSYLALHRLIGRGHPVVAIGAHSGKAAGVDITTAHPQEADVDTVTLYINPKRQPAYYDYIVSLQPRRVIFNPGTENEEFAQLLRNKGIEAKEACTLVMLANGLF
ncbi:MAG TPA: CoA-binding protein [Phnomibacter sp.]|nr:CoA-binding protein [Phnomibacter sp.]